MNQILINNLMYLLKVGHQEGGHCPKYLYLVTAYINEEKLTLFAITELTSFNGENIWWVVSLFKALF